MYGKKEGKFNTGKGTKNVRKELDPSKFGLKKEKPKSLYSDERGRKIIQSQLEALCIQVEILSIV